MKETTNLPQSLCGKTQYFGDRFVNGVCQYKKCLDTCVESEYQFEYKDQIYNRKRYCCKNNLCNGEFELSEEISSPDACSIFRCIFVEGKAELECGGVNVHINYIFILNYLKSSE